MSRPELDPTPESADDLEAMRDSEAVERIDAALVIHTKVLRLTVLMCHDCGVVWPCATARALGVTA